MTTRTIPFIGAAIAIILASLLGTYHLFAYEQQIVHGGWRMSGAPVVGGRRSSGGLTPTSDLKTQGKVWLYNTHTQASFTACTATAATPIQQDAWFPCHWQDRPLAAPLLPPQQLSMRTRVQEINTEDG